MGNRDGTTLLLYGTNTFGLERWWDGNAHVVDAATVATASWYHVVSTFDGSNIKIYVNGVQGSNPGSPAGLQSPNAVPLSVGASSGGGNLMTGELDELAIYGQPSTRP